MRLFLFSEINSINIQWALCQMRTGPGHPSREQSEVPASQSQQSLLLRYPPPAQDSPTKISSDGHNEYHRRGGYNNRTWLSLSSGGWDTEIRHLQVGFSGTSLLGCHVVISLCVHNPGISPSFIRTPVITGWRLCCKGLILTQRPYFQEYLHSEVPGD